MTDHGMMGIGGGMETERLENSSSLSHFLSSKLWRKLFHSVHTEVSSSTYENEKKKESTLYNLYIYTFHGIIHRRREICHFL